MEKIEFTGLFGKSQFLNFKYKLREQMYEEITGAYKECATDIKKKMQDQAASVFQVKRPVFLKSFSFRIYSSYKKAPPSILFGSKIGFMGIHQYGGTVTPKGQLLLIPVGQDQRRTGTKTFKQYINTLLESKNAYFKPLRNGNLGVFTKANKETRDFTKRLSGQKKLQKFEDTLIAIAVKKVTVRKRLKTIETVEQNAGQIAQALQRRFNEKF